MKHNRLLLPIAAVLVSIACLLAPAGAAAEEDPVGCGYGTGGPNAPNLCWFDMSGYDDAIARSEAGQPMSVTLPGGYVVEFTLTSRSVPGAPNYPKVEARKVPIEARFAFGVSGGGYVGVPGKPALYSQDAGSNGVELKLSDISVVDSEGLPVTGYSFVVADAENNINGESFTWTSDKPLSLVGVLNPSSANGCHNGLTGLGTTTVTCTGKGGEASPSLPRYDAVLVGADTPSNVALSMRTFARSGVAFAIMTSKVQVTKNVVGRVRAADSFDVSVASPEGSTLASASTGATDTATTGELTVLPSTDGASYTFSETATPASGTRQSDYSRSWSCTNNGVAQPSLPSGGAPSVSVSPKAGDFIACTVTNTQLPADLSVRKSASVASAEAGDQITFTLEAENEGPSTADLATLKDTLPAGLAYVSDDGACDTSVLPTIECDLGTLAAGESRQVEIVAAVQPGAAGTVLSNTGEVSALQPDDDPGNDESTVKTPVAPFADLAIGKTVSPEVVGSPGEQVTYALEVENKSQSESDPTLVTDTLPAGLAYVSDDGACDTAALPTIECDLGGLTGGATKTVHIVAEVEASAAGKAIENTASVTGSSFDPELADNESSATLEVEPLSDLAISKTPGGSSVQPGGQLIYLLKAENKGPTADPSVEVTDTLPAGLAYVSDDGGCDTSALPEIRCDLGALADGGSETVALVTEVIASSGTIENTGEVSGTNPDAEPDNNAATAMTPIEPVSDLMIEKTASVPAVKPGETLTYTLEVENQGPSASAETIATDTLPADLTYVSDDGGCDISGLPAVECDLGTLATGASATVEILTAVKAGAAGSIQNTARVDGPNPDPEPGDDESSATTSVTPLASDLALAKSAASAGAVSAGETITYTLAATNHGPDHSPQTVVTDTLPAALTYVSDDAGCDASALPKLECELGTLASGESRELHVVASVASTGAQTIRNSATVSGANPDPVPSNNPDAAETPVAPPTVTPSPPPGESPAPPKRPRQRNAGKPRLVVKKVASSGFARPGAVIGYRITVWNKGTKAARDVEVCDHPPARQETLRTEPAVRNEAAPCWRFGRLPVGQKRVVRLTARVAETSGGATQRNRVTVTAANAPGKGVASAGVRVKPLPDTGCGLRLQRPSLMPPAGFRC